MRTSAASQWSSIDIRMAITTELFIFPAAIAFFASALYGQFHPQWLSLWLNMTPAQTALVGSGFAVAGVGVDLYRRWLTSRWHRNQAELVRDLDGAEILFVGDHALIQKALARFAVGSGARFSTLDHLPAREDTPARRVVVWYPGKAQDPNSLRTSVAEIGSPVVLLATRDQGNKFKASGDNIPDLDVLLYPFVMGTLLDAVRRLAGRQPTGLQTRGESM